MSVVIITKEPVAPIILKNHCSISTLSPGHASFFFKCSPDVFLLILEKEKERDREKQQCEGNIDPFPPLWALT